MGFKHDGFNINYEDKPEIMRWTFALYLKDKTKESLFKEFRNNHRRILNRIKNSGIEIRELTKDEVNIHFEMTEKTSQRREFNNRTKDYYNLMYESYSNDELKFVAAFLNTDKYYNETVKDLNDRKNQYDSLNNKESGKLRI